MAIRNLLLKAPLFILALICAANVGVGLHNFVTGLSWWLNAAGAIWCFLAMQFVMYCDLVDAIKKGSCKVSRDGAKT